MSRPERRFTFLLAGHLGMTVEQLLGCISSAELSEWMAYFQFEPFGNDWQQTSYLCAMVGNTAGGKRGGGSFKPEDFLPVKPPRRRPKPMTGAEMFSVLKLFASRQ